MYVFVVAFIIAVKQVSSCLNVHIRFQLYRNRTYSWRSKSRFFQNEYLWFCQPKHWPQPKLKLQIMLLSLTVYTENYIKLKSVANSMEFVI